MLVSGRVTLEVLKPMGAVLRLWALIWRPGMTFKELSHRQFEVKLPRPPCKFPRNGHQKNIKNCVSSKNVHFPKNGIQKYCHAFVKNSQPNKRNTIRETNSNSSWTIGLSTQFRKGGEPSSNHPFVSGANFLSAQFQGFANALPEAPAASGASALTEAEGSENHTRLGSQAFEMGKRLPGWVGFKSNRPCRVGSMCTCVWYLHWADKRYGFVESSYCKPGFCFPPESFLSTWFWSDFPIGIPWLKVLLLMECPEIRRIL